MEGKIELHPDSTDVFERNMVDTYTDRPNSQYKNGMYGIVDHILFCNNCSTILP